MSSTAAHIATGSPADLSLRIETPENVVLTYQLAGPAARLGAYVVDLCIRALIFAGVWLVMALGSRILGGAAEGTVAGIVMLTWFAMEWGYYVFCEWAFSGKTVGKSVMGLRVIHERGHPVTLWSSMLRNLLRAIDAFPFLQLGPAVLPTQGAALVSMVLSPRLQRIGDRAAGTVVISERFATLPREPIIIEKIDPLPPGDVSGPAPPDRVLSLIDEFLSRRHVLSHERGHELCAELARTLAERLHYRGDRQLVERYPMAFLARVYVTWLRRDEDHEQDAGVPWAETTSRKRQRPEPAYPTGSDPFADERY
ncbi:MAG: RDD family protein [Planctomycetes bacterium]|nr:RDD family protein [Planctomycetota bacterium]